MHHELKIWPEPFKAVFNGTKLYEVRKADRPFAVGDTVVLKEWNPQTASYTGFWIKTDLTYLTPAGSWGLPVDMCVFGIKAKELLADSTTVKIWPRWTFAGKS